MRIEFSPMHGAKIQETKSKGQKSDWCREVENVGKKSTPNASLPMGLVCLWVDEPDLNVQYPAGHSEGLRDQGKEPRDHCAGHGLEEICTL